MQITQTVGAGAMTMAREQETNHPYAVYMKEGDPLYGTVYHVGDYLPDGTQFSGTNDEWEAFIAEDMIRRAQEEGLEVTEEDGAYVIHLD